MASKQRDIQDALNELLIYQNLLHVLVDFIPNYTERERDPKNLTKSGIGSIIVIYLII